MYTNSAKTILNREDYRTIILGLKLIVEHRIQGEWKAAERLITRFEIERRPLDKAQQPSWVPIKGNWPSGQIKPDKRSHWSFHKPSKTPPTSKSKPKVMTADEIIAEI